MAASVAGIEFDAAGRRVAYHMWRDPPGLPLGASVELLRVPTEDVVHVFRPDAPGQVHGVSWFAPVLLRLADLDAAHDAQLTRQKIAALLTGFVVDPTGNSAGFAGPPDGQGGLEPRRSAPRCPRSVSSRGATSRRSSRQEGDREKHENA